MATALVVLIKPSKWLVRRSLKLLKLPCNFHSSPKSPNATSLLSPSTSTSCGIVIGEHKYSQAFKRFDRNGDGKMSGEELAAYFMSIGDPLPRQGAQEVIANFDSDGDGLLEFDDFVRMMEPEGGGETDGDLRRVFEIFKADEGSGGITAQGLQQALARLGEKEPSYEECASMIRAFDLDGNGVVDFHEFQRMMASN